MIYAVSETKKQQECSWALQRIGGLLRLHPEINGLVQGMIPMILGFQWFLEVAPWIYPDPQPTFQSSKQPKRPFLSHEQCGGLNSGSQNIGLLESPRKMKGRIYPRTNHQSTRGLGQLTSDHCSVGETGGKVNSQPVPVDFTIAMSTKQLKPQAFCLTAGTLQNPWVKVPCPQENHGENGGLMGFKGSCPLGMFFRSSRGQNPELKTLLTSQHG